MSGRPRAETSRAFATSYNQLNLPQSITGSGANVTYTYDATGRKLRKVSNGSAINYVSGIQYKADGSIDFIQTEEGVAQNNGGSYLYHYNLADHLGNVRYTFDIYNGQIRRLQQDDYYAFGLRKSISPVTTNDNKFLYNGKELQDETGLYDYGRAFIIQ